jgi:lysophospholipase L1-like esterase
MGKTVKIFCMGDSLTEGDGTGSAYRYPLFEKLFRAGADFRFIGPKSRRDDVRLPALYNYHGATCGHIIGDDTEEGGGSLRKNLRDPEYAKTLDGADIILLWIGANDYGQNRGENIVSRYIDLLHIVWGFAPNATVYAASQIAMFGYNTELDRWLKNEAEDLFAKEGKRLVFVELEPDGDILRRELGDFPEDDGHPTEAGNVKIAARWFDAIIDEVLDINANGKDDGTPTLIRAESVVLHECKDVIALGESLTLCADVLPENASVKTLLFESSDTNIAAVDCYGRVFPKSCGEVTLAVKALDGGASVSKKIKIAGISDLSLGMRKVFVSDMTTTDGWEGNTEKIATRFNKFHIRYLGEPFEISAKDFSVDCEKLLLEFTHRTANHGDRRSDNYSSVSLGNLELRVCGQASKIELWTNGKLLGSYAGVPITAMNDEFALKFNRGKASVYRNGELLFECDFDAERISGGLKLLWHEFWTKSDIRNVKVYTE